MIKIYFIILIIAFIIKSSLCQSNSCPQLFKYVINSQTGQTEGRITISNVQSGENILLLKMTYPSHISNNDPGSIGLIKSNADVVKDLLQNRPIIYRVHLPIINPTPNVKEIIFNGQIICSSSETQQGLSEITLTHKLNIPNSVRLQSTNPPSQQQSPPRQQPTNNQVVSSPIASNSVTCGTTVVPVNLIFGGKKMSPGAWPWLTPMFEREQNGNLKYLCGGTIIAPHAIISAAHCVFIGGTTRNPQTIVMGLGIFNINKINEPNTYIANVNSIIAHPEYLRKTIYDADISIIILSQSYSYNQIIRPACLWQGPNDINNIINRDGHVAGWGLAKINGGSESEASIIEAKVVSAENCLRSNQAFSSITSERNLCAGYRDGNGPCIGDSGSGLMMEINNRWHLRALVSGSLSHITTTCDLKEYVIYTDVAQFLNWIKTYVSI